MSSAALRYVNAVITTLALLIAGSELRAQGHYEDHYTFKHGKPFILDPYIWAYSKAFAERFRMPEAGINPEMKGALAVAWRMTAIGRITCGYSGKADNCWKPLDCQLDVYYDSAVQLPWNYPEVVRDNLMLGLSSAEFIHDLSDSKRMRRYVDKKDPKRPRGPMNTGGTIEFGKNLEFRNGSSTVVLFDRDYEPGVALISRVGPGVCPPKVAGPGVLRFIATSDSEKAPHGKAAPAKLVHTIELPESYLSRLRPSFEAQNKPNEDFMTNQIRQFFERR